MRVTLLLILLVILGGCASQSSSIQYYLLYSPQDARHLKLETDQTLKLSRLTVPEYLKQRGMPVMTEGNQVHISKSHMWAESFETSLEKLLRYALEPNVLLVTKTADDTSNTELYLDILHLIPTNNGEVSISARYQLRRDGKIVITHAYSKNYPLVKDGYAHSVDVYRQAIYNLANEIGVALQSI